MTELEAYAKFIDYLKSHLINYHEDIDERGIKRISMVYTDYPNYPNKAIESCVYFYKECIECKVYYTQLDSNICKKSLYRADLYRLLNYINANIWPCVCDFASGKFYQPAYLYTPRIILTEDGYFDITATTLIPYDFYELAPLQTEDYMTACIPDLMHKLSPIIFSLLGANIKIDDAIKYISETFE